MNKQLQNKISVLGLTKLVETHLWAKILMALFMGSLVGYLIGPSFGLIPTSFVKPIGNWLGFPGQIFLTLIQMVIIPLVFASVITGIADGEDVESIKKVGVRILIYNIVTTSVAISVGIFLTLWLKPGSRMSKKSIENFMGEAPSANVVDNVKTLEVSNLPDTLVSLLPQNPLNSMVEGQMFQIVIFAIVVGVAILGMERESRKPVLKLLNSIKEISMTVIGWSMQLAPLAVFGLMARLTLSVGAEVLFGLSGYVGTVVLGLFIILLFYLFLLSLIGKTNPLSFLSSAKDVQLLAFSTSSSAAVMPLTMKTAEEKLNVSPQVSKIVIPLGTTINMDGTALYQGVATVFLAQVFQVDLSVSQLILVVFTSTAASIGAPGTPGVGIMVLASILSSVGIPASGIMLIIGVDRLLDMSRTVINVTGDLTAAKILNRLSQ